MTARLFQRFGDPASGELNGAESRALRASLNLERRHVVAMVNALEIFPEPLTLDRLTQWERSKGRGYPLGAVTALEAFSAGVDRLAATFAGPVARRPVGGRRIAQLMALAQGGLHLDRAAFDMLDQGGGDFWQVLCDAAINRAALAERTLKPFRVVLDRDPEDGPS